MQDPKTAPVIFISYSHLDEKAFAFVSDYLRSAEKYGVIRIWNDSSIYGGGDWYKEIEKNLRSCDIFILLVSPNSMVSEFVVEREIAVIRERQAKSEDVHFYPLLMAPTPDIALELIKDKNIRPRNKKPFLSYPLRTRQQHMTEVTNEIVEIAMKIAGRKEEQERSRREQRESEKSTLNDSSKLGREKRQRNSAKLRTKTPIEGNVATIFTSSLLTRRVYVSLPADAFLRYNLNDLKWGIVDEIQKLGYTPEIFTDPRGGLGLASSKAWNPREAEEIARHCVGAAILGMARWEGQSGDIPVLLPTEFNHYEGSLARTLRLPTLVLAQTNIAHRVVFDPLYGGFVGKFPQDADSNWLRTPEFRVPFEYWPLGGGKTRCLPRLFDDICANSFLNKALSSKTWGYGSRLAHGFRSRRHCTGAARASRGAINCRRFSVYKERCSF
jgi:hypothetical protein